MNTVLLNDTYFGIITEYCHTIDYVQTLSLVSKFHYEFPMKEQYNFHIIMRMLGREFFDLKHKEITELIGIKPRNIYDSIYILHHFYMNFNLEFKTRASTNWMKRDFLSRWRYLTSNNDVNLYGVKHWLSKLQISNNLNPDHMHMQLILHSNMNGDKNTFHVDSCTELMTWSLQKNGGQLPKITEFTRLLVTTLDINQNRKQVNYVMFAWCLNYLCQHFENQIDIKSGDIAQELSALVAELVLTLHTANMAHGILKQQKKLTSFQHALHQYLIPRRLNKIWSTVIGGNLIHFTTGFTLTVSAFFNCLMGLCRDKYIACDPLLS